MISAPIAVGAADALAQLLANIVRRYLQQLYAICIIWSVETPPNFNHTIDAMLKLTTSADGRSWMQWPNYYLIMMSDSAGGPNALSGALETAVNYGCQAFIVADNVAWVTLSAYASVIYACLQRYPQYHFVIAPNGVSSNKAFTILEHPVIVDVPNMLIVRENEQGDYDLITSRFVGRDSKEAATAIWLDTFGWQDEGNNGAWESGRFQRNAHLFPDKLHSLDGRIVRLALFNYKPYTVWEEVLAGQGNANAPGATEERTLSIDGTESLLMLVFCERHNCTLEISLDEAGQWGEIWDNRSGTGVLGAVAERRADVGISALYEWHHEYQFLDFSMPISRTGITCIVPKPQLLSGLYLPAMPFSWQMWLGVFISLIVGILSLISVECFLRWRGHRRGALPNPKDAVRPGEIAFQMCAMYLFQASNMMSKPSAERMILTCVLLIGLMIGNAYSGGLASIMTVPQYEPPIDTPHQMAERNLDWGGTQDAWLFSILLATQPDIEKLVRLFHAVSVDALKRRTKTGDFGFSVERLPYGHFAVGDYIDEEAMNYLQLMHTDIYYEYALAMTSKTWPLKFELDALIMRLAQSGIQSMWEWQVVVKYSDNSVQLRVATSHSSHAGNGPQPLSIARVLGAFIIWLCGMAAASLCFAAEIGLLTLVRRGRCRE